MKNNNLNHQIKKSTIREIIGVLLRTKHPRFYDILGRGKGIGFCYACGNTEQFIQKKIIDDHLTKTWGLTRRLRGYFDTRESTRCSSCKSSLRSNLHARAILETLFPNELTLRGAINNRAFSKLKVAEINACGALHEMLIDIPSLHHSEYDPKDSKIKHEDITRLTYKSNYFDLVLTSETLEHVPEWVRALDEINRVLKVGGHHIFTVPAILSRKTRTRAIMQNGKIKNILEKSFHGCTRNVSSDDYIVCNEFGADILEDLENAGFDTKIYYTNLLNYSDPNIVFVSKKIKTRNLNEKSQA